MSITIVAGEGQLVGSLAVRDLLEGSLSLSGSSLQSIGDVSSNSLTGDRIGTISSDGIRDGLNDRLPSSTSIGLAFQCGLIDVQLANSRSSRQVASIHDDRLSEQVIATINFFCIAQEIQVVSTMSSSSLILSLGYIIPIKHRCIHHPFKRFTILLIKRRSLGTNSSQKKNT